MNPTPPRRVNDAYQTRNVLGRNKLYLNWGLWDAQTTELDEAALALVLELARRAGIGPDTSLLDVGFGFGDQLIDWCRHAQLGRATGVNICPEQASIARRRLVESGLGERVDVLVADACALPFAEASFDAVTAVECAFHFRTRERFFQEARRVLKGGGRLVLADFIGVARPDRRQRFAQRVTSRIWGFAPGSFCSQEEYRALLLRVGFKDVTLDVITDRVLPPGLRYARQRLWDDDLRRRMQPAVWLGMLGILGLSRLLGDPLPGEYVLIRAVR